jgi:rhodanese-related sulfurtransferase
MGQTCDKLSEIDAMELQVLLQLKENPPLLIDVRQPQEYVAGHIPGALLFPLGQVELARPQIDENRTVVVYCRSGKRSLAAAGILCRLGLTEVFSLKGGILGWHYELITGPPQGTLSSEDVKTVMDILLLAMEKELQARRVHTRKN